MGICRIRGRSFAGPSMTLIIILAFLMFTFIFPYSEGYWTEWRGDPLHHAVEEGNVPEVGELIWSYQTGDQVLSSPVFYKDSMLIGSDDGNLYSFNVTTGEVFWKFKTDGQVQSTPLINEDKAYFGSFDRYFYCISLPDPGNGIEPTLIWRTKLSGAVISSCHIYQDSYIIADDRGTVYRIASNGSIIWDELMSDAGIWASPLLIEDQGMFILGDIVNHLWFMDLDDGSLIDEMTFGDYTEMYSSGIYKDGIFYTVGGYDKKFYAIDVASREISWYFDIGHDAYSTPVIEGDRIYFGSFEFTWCLPLEDPDGNGNISEDEVIWSSPTHDFQGGSSPMVVDGKILIGSDDWNLYCFDKETGEELWTYETRGYIYSSPALFEEKLYFGSSDRNVYCIGKRPPGLVMEAKSIESEITSDNITAITITITNDTGAPVADASVSFITSAGFIAFDEFGNTRIDHITDNMGKLTVYFHPVQVSSRSTIDITIFCEKEGLQGTQGDIQIIVEPGEDPPDPREVSKDEKKRIPWFAAIIVLIIVNILLLLVVLLWFIRNRFEDKEVEGK
jgi:outer membrane protein assembly factor BamB